MTDAEIIKLERIITDSLRSSCTTGDYSRIIDLSECCASITYKDAALFALGVCLNELFVVYE